VEGNGDPVSKHYAMNCKGSMEAKSLMNQNSSVSKVTGYRLSDWGLIPNKGRLFSPHHIETGSGLGPQ
jgi:hypothetical protein